MAASQSVATKTVTVIEETAADVITITRTPVMNTSTGLVEIQFGVKITYSAIEYHGESLDSRTEIVRTVTTGSLSISAEQVAALFSTALVTSDGGSTSLGELLADLSDNLIIEDVKATAASALAPRLSYAIAGEVVTVTVGNALAGAIYSWEVSDSSASITPGTGTCTVEGAARPYTVTCSCTLPVGSLSVTSSSSITVL